jgi:anti-sigma-K factor RskA
VAADDDDIAGLAGEYVLGTLGPAERRAVEARLRIDPALRAEVAGWEARLQPLADAADPAEPHPATLAAILNRIDRSAPEAASPPAARLPGDIVALRRSVRRWRWATAAVTAAAAGLAALVVFDRASVIAPAQEFVAVLTAEGVSPAFVAAVDMRSGTISVRRVGGDPAPPDRSYHLWAIRDQSAPVSLGLVDDAAMRTEIPNAADGVTIAISLEPRGGSPEEGPTGPVIFSGRLVPAE